jgi:hypothetical protein
MIDDDESEKLYLTPGSKKNDLIIILNQIEKRMEENPGMTIEQSVEASGITMSKYRKAKHLRAVRKRASKCWGKYMD